MCKIQMPLLYITDKPIEGKKFGLAFNNAEGNTIETVKEIEDALRTCCTNVTSYDDLTQFTIALAQQPNCIVFSTYYGAAFPSSKAQVPAICEANNVYCVGADSYAHMLCNDKALSKLYLRQFGLHSAASVLIRDIRNNLELQAIETLTMPVVIKPNYGGGSNGISQSSLKYNAHEAVEFAKMLCHLQSQPILVEEYIEGYEIELILFGNKKSVAICDEVQLIIQGQDYYKDFVWGLETKKIQDDVQFCSSNFLSNEDKQRCIHLFSSFRKMEFMRIDCRIHNNKAYIIELSPDCYLGRDGGFYFAFEQKGFTYNKMFQMILQNSLKTNSSF